MLLLFWRGGTGATPPQPQPPPQQGGGGPRPRGRPGGLYERRLFDELEEQWLAEQRRIKRNELQAHRLAERLHRQAQLAADDEDIIELILLVLDA